MEEKLTTTNWIKDILFKKPQQEVLDTNSERETGLEFDYEIADVLPYSLDSTPTPLFCPKLLHKAFLSRLYAHPEINLLGMRDATHAIF